MLKSSAGIWSQLKGSAAAGIFSVTKKLPGSMWSFGCGNSATFQQATKDQLIMDINDQFTELNLDYN